MDEERHYSVECTPPDPEYVMNSLDPELEGFINQRGFKILHQNMNGLFEKLDTVKA